MAGAEAEGRTTASRLAVAEYLVGGAGPVAVETMAGVEGLLVVGENCGGCADDSTAGCSSAFPEDRRRSRSGLPSEADEGTPPSTGS